MCDYSLLRCATIGLSTLVSKRVSEFSTKVALALKDMGDLLSDTTVYAEKVKKGGELKEGAVGELEKKYKNIEKRYKDNVRWWKYKDENADIKQDGQSMKQD